MYANIWAYMQQAYSRLCRVPLLTFKGRKSVFDQSSQWPTLASATQFRYHGYHVVWFLENNEIYFYFENMTFKPHENFWNWLKLKVELNTFFSCKNNSYLSSATLLYDNSQREGKAWTGTWRVFYTGGSLGAYYVQFMLGGVTYIL